MGGDSRNEGIYQSGGSIQADQIAVGRNARAAKILNVTNDVLEQKGLQEIRDKLDELLKVIIEHANSLDAPDEVLDSTEIVAKELAKDKPNKLTVTGVLTGIADGVKSVASIATAAEALRKAVALFL
jgi:hypothetical protein